MKSRNDQWKDHLVIDITLVHRLSPKPEVETPTKLSGAGSGTDSLTGATRTVQPLMRSSRADSLRRMKSMEGTSQQRSRVPSNMFHRGATLTNENVMKRLSKLLPALAMVLAATLAMAMNFADSPIERYAEDPDPNIEAWYDLTDVDPGDETYDCNTLVSATCSHVDPMFTANQVEAGQFVKNGPLPPAIP